MEKTEKLTAIRDAGARHRIRTLPGRRPPARSTEPSGSSPPLRDWLAALLPRARRREVEALVAARTAELEREKEKVARQAELDHVRSQLFASISYELRTPLTLILGPLRDFDDGLFGALTPAARREVGRMHANAARLAELVNQIFDTARLEAGGLELRVIREDIGAFVTLLAGRFVAVAERRCLDFSADVPEQPVWLYFDPEQLDKVLTNLLSNAFRLTPRGGRIRIAVAEPKDGRVRVSVRDTGRGIAPRDLPHLFDRLYQAANGLGRRHPGTGLGLALACDLVDLHGDTLDVRSTPGKGSTFRIGLRLGRDHFRDEQIVEQGTEDTTSSSSTPASWQPAADAVEAVLREADADLTENGDPAEDGEGTAAVEDRTTLLVVDDHPDLRAYVRRHLEDRYRVIEAAHGAEALERARQVVPDLVVSEVIMTRREPAPTRTPDDGLWLCRAIKHDPELEFIPVILLTAKTSTEARLEGLAECADDIMTKPFDVRELRARIDNLIAQRQRLREHFLAAAEQAPAAEARADPGTEAAAGSSFLAQVSAVIDEKMDDEDFHVDALARHLAMSRSSLYQRLEEVGQSPGGLILERRLGRAAELLRNGAGSVGEVACLVGFKSVSHFTQRFHERFGTTPSSYRRGAT